MAGWYRKGGKRVFDLVGASFLLVLFAGLMAGVALAIWIVDGRPILFKQARGGYRGRPFFLIKFRSMTDARDIHGMLLPDERRLTRLGRFIRTWSMDELPALIQVIRGEMSLVGPRPLLWDYMAQYDDRQMRRHTVRPGLTGLVQIRGRNSLDWDQKFALDLEYVNNVSLWLDIMICLKTVRAVLSRRGVSADGHATMPVWRPKRAGQ